jgi:hypothetical protein
MRTTGHSLATRYRHVLSPTTPAGAGRDVVGDDVGDDAELRAELEEGKQAVLHLIDRSEDPMVAALPQDVDSFTSAGVRCG